MAYLRFLDDGGKIKTKLLDAEHFVIGRAETCQLSFDSDMISREHLRIDLEDGGRYRISDLDSRNRTYVNGELANETLLTPGSIIRFGDRIVEFVDDSASPERIQLECLTFDKSEPPDCEWIKIKTPLSLTHVQVEQLATLIGEQALTARAEDIADAALGQFILDIQAERGLIALRGDGKRDLLLIAHRSLKRTSDGKMTLVSQSFVTTPLVQGVGGRYPRSAGLIDAKLGFANTAMVAPLTAHGETLGVLYVDRPVSKKPFPPTALQYCAAAGAHLGALIGGTIESQVRVAGKEGAVWLSTIRRVQDSLTAPISLGDTFDADMKLHAGRLQCGDFGAVFHLDEQRCGILVLDGGGGGITGIAQAAAISSAFETTLIASDEALTDPGPMFNAINSIIARSRARQILPCTFVGLDIAAGKLAYINAGGMPPLLMVAPGRLLTLDHTSLVLGVDPDYLFQPTRVDLPEAFRIVCYTDGVTEATSAAGQPFGDQRLHDTLLDRESFSKASEIVAAISKAWTTHLTTAQPADDALILAVGRG